ncbi:hypothetical protein N7456_000662 [Penicillium angulare]|uniref:Uncharacterized protein n=1 Tax=Penicillium angulare TaxID=116970 RepID=A0A9W9KSG0_9EURO|nr:hypothetical protein N7456_000662 [Penicillium angulare]
MARHKLTYLAITSGLTIYGTHLGLNHLEKQYPNQPLSTGSKALSTPDKSTQHTPYTDIYAARIPVAALLRSPHVSVPPNTNAQTKTEATLEEAWARTLLKSPILKTEASLFSLLNNFKYTPGDLEKPFKKGTTLVQGIMTIQREIDAEPDSNGLLVSWKMADEPRTFFEKIASWGYPWRLMSGGRHEMSVSEVFEVEGEDFVDVRFASAHDYEVVRSEGDLDQQKILPEWTNRLHRGFARLILDFAVRELQ